MKTALITGASTGIGRATATHLAKQGWTVFAGVRKEADGEALSENAVGDLRPILLDVVKTDQIEAAARTIGDHLGQDRLAGLVNNAGIAMMGPLALQPMDEFRAHFEVNVFGLLAVTQAFVPLLGGSEDRTGAPGRIVNITSVGGKLASPFLGAYTATKHAVEAMTDTIRRELAVYGIDAIAIGPGSVRTPIWDKAEEKNEGRPYDNSVWSKPLKVFEEVMLKGGRDGLDPLEIARIVEEALTAEKPKARYAPVPNKLMNFTIPSLLPKRRVDKALWDRFGFDVD